MQVKQSTFILGVFVFIILVFGMVYFLLYSEYTTKNKPDGTSIISKYRWFNQDISIPLTIEKDKTFVTSIGKGAFKNKKLVRVTIPKGIVNISEKAFRNNKLSSVTIPNSVTIIDNYAFDKNPLTSITIPYSVFTIGERAFGDIKIKNSTNPFSVTINSDTITIVGYNSNQLIPYSTTIEDQAFGDINIKGNTSSFSVIKYNNNITIIGNISADTNISIPEKINELPVVYIGEKAFEKNNLTNITIPNTVTVIGNNAFAGNKLTSIIIPDSVTSIGDYVFDECDNLTSVTFQGTILSSEFGNAFNGDLRDKYYEEDEINGTPGTYIKSNIESEAWTKIM